ncbi:hypothetical protein H6G81_04495 [Scytonema hofmannii FACHB-248]|uniref:Uncharacterized protein n=1 Tax=Scytonema hofmannii FACHB-248 TaxID=1842502 RepID=A0ABR8GKV2_9CYAN|nr:MULTISPECIES: hypothetical protein [Nostocales]MBD2603809.1 hypothetical protein [Scytonema hofmannii FACHB-248]
MTRYRFSTRGCANAIIIKVLKSSFTTSARRKPAPRRIAINAASLNPTGVRSPKQTYIDELISS